MMKVDIHSKVISADVSARLTSLMDEISGLFLRVAELEQSHNNNNEKQKTASSSSPSNDATTSYPATPRDDIEVKRVKADLARRGVRGAKFHWVPSDYYEHPLSWRRDILKAPSTAHLCKSMFIENTSHNPSVPNDPIKRNNERYYIAVFQYVEKFDSEKLMRYFREANPGVGKKNFNFRVLSEKGQEVTGFTPGGFCPFGMISDVPIVLSARLMELAPPKVYLGGGHVDLKVEVDMAEMVRCLKPLVVDITLPLSAEELDERTSKNHFLKKE